MKKKLLYTLFALFVGGGATMFAFAGTSLSTISTEALRQRIRSGFDNTQLLTVEGYGKLLYQYDSYSALKNDFSVRSLFVWAKGDLSPKIRYMFMSELSSPVMLEYYVDWIPLEGVTLRGGQFKVPFSLESNISLARLESIFNSRTVNALAGMADDVLANGGGGRDVGVQLSGVVNKAGREFLSYSVGVFQGAGINTRDNNNSKDFAGTVCLYPSSGWQVSLGGYWGRAYYQKEGESFFDNHKRRKVALGTVLKLPSLSLRAEHIRANDGGLKRHGTYLLAQYVYKPDKWDFFARGEQFVKDEQVKSTAVDLTLGGNYHFAPLCRVQVNYQLSRVNSSWDAHKTISHLFAAELQLFF